MKNRKQEVSLKEVDVTKIKKSFLWPVITLLLLMIIGFYLAVASTALIMTMIQESYIQIPLVIISFALLLVALIYPLNGITKRMKDLREGKKIIIRGTNFSKSSGAGY